MNIEIQHKGERRMKTIAKFLSVILLGVIVLGYIGSKGLSGSSDDKIVDAMQFRGFNREIGQEIGTVSSGVEFIRLIILPYELRNKIQYLNNSLSIQIAYANGVSKEIKWSDAEIFEYEGKQVYGLSLVWRSSIGDYSTSKPKKVIFTFRHSSGSNIIVREMI